MAMRVADCKLLLRFAIARSIDESCPVPDLLVGFAGENGYQAGETITATISAIAPKDWYEEGHTESEWVEQYCLQYGMRCIQTEKEYVIPKS